MRTLKNKSAILEKLGQVADLLIKCGGPGGTMGPCPGNHQSQAMNDKPFAMSREDAESFSRDSKWPGEFYHGTSSHNVESIKKNGFNVQSGVFGSGVYLTENKNIAEDYAKQRGSAQVLELRVRVKNPLEFDLSGNPSTWESQPAYKKWLELTNNGKQGETEKKNLMDAGYDAVSVTFGGSSYKIVLDPQNIVVVED